MISPEENLKNIIEDIQNNKIMLPDFQRQFDWDVEKQRKLVASVLTQLPVGGILLLEAPSSDYKSKRIGLDSKEAVVGKLPERTQFLLDGQQRMTCLTNVFSDVIHFASGKMVSKLASRQLLANRFYLKIRRWDVSVTPGSDDDLFGIRTLDFRFDVSKKQEPVFLTADIIDEIECRPFLASDYGKKPYMPCGKYTDELDDYCFQTAGVYLIPLFLLVGLGEKDDGLRRKRLLAIVKRIKEGICTSISTYYANLEDNEKSVFAREILTDTFDYDEYVDSDDKDSVFDSKISDKADLWEDYFQKYLYSCVENLRLNKIEMPEGSRARAIDIYENMNMGGLSLCTLDLVAARVAKESSDSLYERIVHDMTSNTTYLESAVPTDVKKYIPKKYNATKQIKAISDGRITNVCSDIFLEVLGLYCNNQNYDANEAKSIYSKSASILKLSAKEIDLSCKKVCIAIDRAYAFLQVRCGVKILSDINYKIMIRFIAYIFTNDKWYKDKNVHDKLEAWYWAAVFSGEYDKDQTDRFDSNLKLMIESLSSKAKGFDWILPLKNKILDTAYFSDHDFLLMDKASEDRIPKDHLGKYFCQFYLSRPYSDLISDDIVLSAFTDKVLQRHHVVPLGSVKKISESSDELRKDKTNILNSPLNYIYISDDTNLTISDKSLSEYETSITAQAKSALYINNYPVKNSLTDDAVIRNWLSERHKTIRGAIQNRVQGLL